MLTIITNLLSTELFRANINNCLPFTSCFSINHNNTCKKWQAIRSKHDLFYWCIYVPCHWAYIKGFKSSHSFGWKEAGRFSSLSMLSKNQVYFYSTLIFTVTSILTETTKVYFLFLNIIWKYIGVDFLIWSDHKKTALLRGNRTSTWNVFHFRKFYKGKENSMC